MRWIKYLALTCLAASLAVNVTACQEPEPSNVKPPTGGGTDDDNDSSATMETTSNSGTDGSSGEESSTGEDPLNCGELLCVGFCRHDARLAAHVERAGSALCQRFRDLVQLESGAACSLHRFGGGGDFDRAQEVDD